MQVYFILVKKSTKNVKKMEEIIDGNEEVHIMVDLLQSFHFQSFFDLFRMEKLKGFFCLYL